MPADLAPPSPQALGLPVERIPISTARGDEEGDEDEDADEDGEEGEDGGGDEGGHAGGTRLSDALDLLEEMERACTSASTSHFATSLKASRSR